jgi:arginyl-tRNA synthetase
MVALSKKSASALGFQAEGEAVSISGRKGIGIKADDLIQAVEERALEEVEKRHPELSQNKKKEIAKKIASAAIRYYMLKFTNNSVVLFDIDEALSFEGETGPYLQYSLVRMNSIRRKAKERGIDFGPARWRENQDYWALLHRASQLDDILEKVREKAELSLLAKYLFSLAQSFNVFYSKYPILNEKDPEERSLRFAIMELVEAKLKIGTYILGIETPERM